MIIYILTMGNSPKKLIQTPNYGSTDIFLDMSVEDIQRDEQLRAAKTASSRKALTKKFKKEDQKSLDDNKIVEYNMRGLSG